MRHGTFSPEAFSRSNPADGVYHLNMLVVLRVAVGYRNTVPTHGEGRLQAGACPDFSSQLGWTGASWRLIVSMQGVKNRFF